MTIGQPRPPPLPAHALPLPQLLLALACNKLVHALALVFVVAGRLLIVATVTHAHHAPPPRALTRIAFRPPPPLTRSLAYCALVAYCRCHAHACTLPRTTPFTSNVSLVALLRRLCCLSPPLLPARISHAHPLPAPAHPSSAPASRSIMHTRPPLYVADCHLLLFCVIHRRCRNLFVPRTLILHHRLLLVRQHMLGRPQTSYAPHLLP